MVIENIFKEHLWGKYHSSLAFCALFNCFCGDGNLYFQFTAAILFYSLEKHLQNCSLSGSLLSYLGKATALMQPELLVLSASENLA